MITLRIRSRYGISFCCLRFLVGKRLNHFFVCSQCRDGLERIKIDQAASVGDLKEAIAANLLGGSLDLTLSQNPELLTTKDDVGFCPGMCCSVSYFRTRKS